MTPPRPGRGAWRIAARVLFLPLCWVAFELVLALLGVGGGAHGAFLPYQDLALPLYERSGTEGTEGDAGPRYVAHESAGPRYVAHERRLGARTFAAEKPADVVRVFCLGGSAMRGLGYSPNASIPGTLERALAAVAPPGRRFEVLNGGVVGIASGQVRAMCADVVARYAPDLVVVMSGNNEFLELHARKFQELEETPLTRLAGRIRDLRSFQLLRSVLHRGAPAGTAVGPSDSDGIRMTASEFIAEVEITPAEIDAALQEYRANLEGIAASCARANVPLVLMTVPANLRWNDPRPEADWVERALADQGLEEARWPAARSARLALLEEELQRHTADASDEQRSALAYLAGKCAEERGDLEAARRAYVLAQDSDPHRRRTTTAMNALVAAVAQHDGARLFDTVALFRSIEPIPAFDLMYDHIHTTPEGALRIATALARDVLALLVPGRGDPGPGLEAFATEERARLAERVRLGEDFPEPDRWIGFCFDPGLLADRDLWKYERQVHALRVLVDGDAAGVPPERRGKALTWLGNALSFELGREEEARACYREARELVPEWSDAVDAGLRRLEAP